jgi:hypothetical protein
MENRTDVIPPSLKPENPPGYSDIESAFSPGRFGSSEFAPPLWKFAVFSINMNVIAWVLRPL